MASEEAYFTVEGTIVGWLHLGDEDDDNIMENDVAIVQTDEGVCYLRWLGLDWIQVDPPPNYIVAGTSGRVEAVEQFAAIGTRIRFDTNLREQSEYTRLSKGQS